MTNLFWPALLIAGGALAALGGRKKEEDDEPTGLSEAAEAVASADPKAIEREARRAAEKGQRVIAEGLERLAKKAKAGKVKPIPIARSKKPPEVNTTALFAVALAKHLEMTTKGKEDKSAVAEFQRRQGGLTIDGLYGPKTAMALGSYVMPPPKPMYWPKQHTQRSQLEYIAWLKQHGQWRAPKKRTRPVTVPVVTVPPETVVVKSRPRKGKAVPVKAKPSPPPPDPLRAVALDLARHLQGKRKWTEDRKRVKTFQRLAGLKVDGLYGPNTATKLGAYVWPPPNPLYWPKENTAAAKAAWAQHLQTKRSA